MNIGLVIQGPIVGGGLTGKTYGEGKTGAPKSSFSSFNALEDVLNNLKSATKFKHIVVSTWENQPTETLANYISTSTRFSLIHNQDPTPNPATIRMPISGIPFLHEANKVRMFFSTRMGVEELIKHKVDYVVKIRTDQTLNLNLLYEEFEIFIVDREKKIFVPSLRENSPWVVSDFFFGGEVSIIRNICKFMENNQQEFHDDLHKDFFFKTHFLTKGIFENHRWGDFLIDTNSDPISPNTDKIVKESILELWAPGSESLYKSIVWRGEPIKYVQADSFFSDSIREFNFNYKLGQRYDNTHFKNAIRNAFGDMPFSLLIWKYFNFLFARKVRQIRNRFSGFRDKFGLRF